MKVTFHAAKVAVERDYAKAVKAEGQAAASELGRFETVDEAVADILDWARESDWSSKWPRWTLAVSSNPGAIFAQGKDLDVSSGIPFEEMAAHALAADIQDWLKALR